MRIKKDFSTFDFDFDFEFPNILILFKIKCKKVLYYSRDIILGICYNSFGLSNWQGILNNDIRNPKLIPNAFTHLPKGVASYRILVVVVPTI